MRILLTSHAERTHLAGMIPLGWSARCSGHDVLFATQPAMVDVVADSGLPVVAVGRDHRLQQVIRHSGAGVPAGVRVPAAQHDVDTEALYAEWSNQGLTDWFDYCVTWWWRVVNDPMVRDLVTLCRQWRPDVVVWETMTFAGAIAADTLECRHARFVWSVDLLGWIWERYRALGHTNSQHEDLFGDWLRTRTGRADGSDVGDLVLGQLTVHTIPPSLTGGPLHGGDGPAVHCLPMRYIPYNGRAVVPAWLREPPATPRVVVTLGTSAIERFGRYVMNVRDILLALGNLAVEVVVTVPTEGHAALGELPANVRVESFVPLDALMATTSVIVDHGGPGTVFTAAVHGVPQLVIHAEYDAPILGELLQRTGAGFVVSPARASAQVVERLVRSLLGDECHRTAAAALASEMRAMADPVELVARLEEWIQS